MIKFVIFFSVLVYVSYGIDESVVDYYERLVLEGIANAQTYVKPVDASAHRPKDGYTKINGTFLSNYFEFYQICFILLFQL